MREPTGLFRIIWEVPRLIVNIVDGSIKQEIEYDDGEMKRNPDQ